MSIHIEQTVPKVNVHMDTEEFDIRVRQISESTGVITIRFTNWITKTASEVAIFASQDQMEDLEHALHVHNLERKMIENGDISDSVTRTEKITA